MHGPSHLQCPVCGHVFLTSQTRTEAAQSCPHCAFVAPGLHFQAVASTFDAQPIAFRKRVARLRPEDSQSTDQIEEVAEPPPPPVHRSHLTQTGAHQKLQSYPLHTLPNSATDEIIAPHRRRPYLRWILTFVLLLAACGVTGMLAWEKIQQRVEIERQNAAMKATDQSTASKVATPTLSKQSDNLESDLSGQEAESHAQRLVQLLFNASSLEERLTAIESPESYRVEVEALFGDAANRPLLNSVSPIYNPPISLRERRRIPMFKVVTSRNRSGALAWIMNGESGQPVIHWPLFRETHEQALSKFLQTKPEKPQWFFVGIQRTHPFEISETNRNDFEAFDIDGSTDGTGRAKVFVHKKTPLSRILAERIRWSEFYYGQVLVSWMDVGGEKRFALLDCEMPPETANPAQK